jgi:lipopolysaccharide transport system permease protein
MMMFLSPIFYPLSGVPEAYRRLIHRNPLTLVLESSKEVLVWGRGPHWHYCVFYMTLCVSGSWMGYAWFQKTRKGFADVI